MSKKESRKRGFPSNDDASADDAVENTSKESIQSPTKKPKLNDIQLKELDGHIGEGSSLSAAQEANSSKNPTLSASSSHSHDIRDEAMQYVEDVLTLEAKPTQQQHHHGDVTPPPAEAVEKRISTCQEVLHFLDELAKNEEIRKQYDITYEDLSAVKHFMKFSKNIQNVIALLQLMKSDKIFPKLTEYLLQKCEKPFWYLKDMIAGAPNQVKDRIKENNTRLATFEHKLDAKFVEWWNENKSQCVDRVKRALSKIKLEPAGLETHSRDLIDCVINELIASSPDNLACPILACDNSEVKDNMSTDYVFLNSKWIERPLEKKLFLHPHATAASTFESEDALNSIVGCGAATRLLVKQPANGVGFADIVRKIIREKSANYNEFSDSTSGPSGALVAAFQQVAQFALDTRRDNLIAFWSDGLLWRFARFEAYRVCLTPYMLLWHPDLPTSPPAGVSEEDWERWKMLHANDETEDTLRTLASLLWSFKLHAQGTAQLSLIDSNPGIIVPPGGSTIYTVKSSVHNRDSRYEIVRVLGRGSDRVAFAARLCSDSPNLFGSYSSEQLFVVKRDIVFGHNPSGQTQNEIEMLQRLRGLPGVPNLLDYGIDQHGFHFLVTDVVGMPIGPFCQANPEQFPEIYARGEEIFGYLGQAGYVLSDINPSCLIVDPNGRVWFADLGACFHKDAPPASPIVTAATASLRVWAGYAPNADDDIGSFAAMMKECMRSAVRRTDNPQIIHQNSTK